MFEQLLRPLNVNGMILRNRIIATLTGDAFDEKALGGAALVVAGHAIVEPGRSSFASEDEPWPFAKYEREATRKRVLKVHQAGSKASIEIFHGGRESRVRDYAKGPCSLTMPDGTKVRAMDEAMMQETLDWYSRTVASCRKIGFDAILLHFGHGWLPDQFLSPFYNHRSDEYGGSIENRARFPLRILEAVRDAVGPHYPVEMRISAYEWVEGSIEFPDVLAFSRMAERYVDMIQVSSGIDKNTVANVHCITTNLEPEMTNLGWARQVKRAVSIPVSVVGAFMTPQVAEDALARNDVDAVAFGRTLIADPDWPRKAMEGRPEDIVPCLRCNNCYHIASDHWNVGCSVNPHYHNESFVPKGIARADTGRNVVILGAGPGGMRAAITAFDRFTRMMSDVYAPYIPVLATGGIASGIISLLANMGVVAPDSLTYMTFYAIFYALIYFFPILLAFTAGKHFKCNPYVAATLGAAIMYPGVSDLLVTGASVNLRDKRLIATMVVSGACGGLVLGLGQVAATNFAFSGILSFGAWLGAKNFPMYCLGIAISLVASFASTAILLKSGGIRDFG